MKRSVIYVFLMAASLVLASCDKHETDQEAIRARIREIQLMIDKTNESIRSLQTVVAALLEKDYVEKVQELFEGGERIGYTIFFHVHGPVVIYDGNRGEDGSDGQNGKDASGPTIGMKQDVDGEWYWTINGGWLLGDGYRKMPVYGESATSPSVKIENGDWYVSYDGGKTWEYLADAEEIVGTSVTGIGYSGDSYWLYMSDGSSIRLPMGGTVGISFDKDSELSAKPGDTLYIQYTLSDASDSYTLAATCTGGLTVEKEQWSGGRGRIKVIVPVPFTEGTVTVFLSQSFNVVSTTFKICSK